MIVALLGQIVVARQPRVFALQRLNAGGSLFVTRPTLRDYIATRGELVERAEAVLGGEPSCA